VAGLTLPAEAYDVKARVDLDPLVTQHASANNVPAALVHRIIIRESRYNARAVGRNGALGLMQIKHETARALGYRGAPAGLLDADTNLTYGVRYLAGAYRVADGDHNRAVGYYARGYYYDAKRRGMLRQLAQQPRVVEEPAPAAPPAAPPPLFAALFGHAPQVVQEPAPVVDPPVEEAAPTPIRKHRRPAAARKTVEAGEDRQGPAARLDPGASEAHRTAPLAAPARRTAALRAPLPPARPRQIGEIEEVSAPGAEPIAPVRRTGRPAGHAGGADANRSARKASAPPDSPDKSP
jgi:hypothetical protein